MVRGNIQADIVFIPVGPRLSRRGEGGARDGGVETVGGDGSETGLVKKKKEIKHRRLVSVPVSPRTSRIKKGGDNNNALELVDVMVSWNMIVEIITSQDTCLLVFLRDMSIVSHDHFQRTESGL